MKNANGTPPTEAWIVKALMVKQPRTVKNLHDVTGVAEVTIGKRLKVLAKINVVKETLGGWAFSNYNPLEETVREAMEQLKGKGFHRQTSSAITNMVNQLNPDKIGATPKEVEPIAWCLSSKLKITIGENGVSYSYHSLIPALQQMARIEIPRYATEEREYIDEQNMSLLINRARTYLRFYPDVLKLIDKRAEIEEEAELIEEELRLDLMKKMKKIFKDEYIVESGKKRKHRSFIGTNIPAQICSHLLHGEPTQVTLEGEEIWFGRLIAKGTHLMNCVREFVNRETDDKSNIETARRIKNARNSAIAMGPEIEHEIREIILDIESKIPLRGYCERYATTDRPP